MSIKPDGMPWPVFGILTLFTLAILMGLASLLIGTLVDTGVLR